VGQFINTGIIHEDVEAAKILDSCINDALRVCGLGNIPTDGDGLATGRDDGGNNSVRARLAGSIIHHHGRAFRSQRLGDRDGEFLDPDTCRQAALETWGDGWSRLFEALE
jgi:hypothetical protein